MITFKEGLTIGDNSPIRINCNVGCNNIADIESELSKLEFIQSCNELPDMMMDLSLIELKNRSTNLSGISLDYLWDSTLLSKIY